MLSRILYTTLAAAAFAVVAPAFAAEHAAPDRAAAGCNTAPPCCERMAEMHASGSDRSDAQSYAAAEDSAVFGVGLDRSMDGGG